MSLMHGPGTFHFQGSLSGSAGQFQASSKGNILFDKHSTRLIAFVLLVNVSDCPGVEHDLLILILL